MKRKTLRYDELRGLVSQYSDRHSRYGDAADAILADYSISRNVAQQLARAWLIEEIDRYRRPGRYAEDDGDSWL